MESKEQYDGQHPHGNGGESYGGQHPHGNGGEASGGSASAHGVPASCSFGDSAVLPPQPVQCTVRPQCPLLLWDGQCRFCERWANRLKRLAGRRIDCQPYQQRIGDFPEIGPEQFESAVFLVLPSGQAYHSAQAVYRALALRWPFGLVLWLYRRSRRFARFSDRRYRAVAATRRCRL